MTPKNARGLYRHGGAERKSSERLETRKCVSISPSLALDVDEAAPFADEPVFDQGNG